MEEHKGYKAFNGNRTNAYGIPFEEGKTYSVKGDIIPGKYSKEKMNGYHMSEEICNTFRYIDIPNNGIEIASVTGFGNCKYFEDNYYGYYDMYVCENLTINKFLKREEYIDIILNESEYEVIKFIRTCPLSYEEIILFCAKFHNNKNILNAICYHQLNIKDIYEKNYKPNDILKKVLKNG